MAWRYRTDPILAMFFSVHIYRYHHLFVNHCSTVLPIRHVQQGVHVTVLHMVPEPTPTGDAEAQARPPVEKAANSIMRGVDRIAGAVAGLCLCPGDPRRQHVPSHMDMLPCLCGLQCLYCQTFAANRESRAEEE